MKKQSIITSALALIAVCLIYNPSSSYAEVSSANPDILAPGHVLLADQSLWSTNVGGNYRLWFQRDGNLVLYDWNQPGHPVAKWTSGTSCKTGCVKLIKETGNLVIYDELATPVWQLRFSCHIKDNDLLDRNNPNAWLRVNSDGNLVLYSEKNEVIWDLYHYKNSLPSHKDSGNDISFGGWPTSTPPLQNMPQKHFYNYAYCSTCGWRSGECTGPNAVGESISASINHTLGNPGHVASGALLGCK